MKTSYQKFSHEFHFSPPAICSSYKNDWVKLILVIRWTSINKHEDDQIKFLKEKHGSENIPMYLSIHVYFMFIWVVDTFM